MAITRTQIAKQMLKQGGRTGFFTAGLAAGDDISPGTSTSGVGGDKGGGLSFRGKIDRTIPTITPKQKPTDDIFFGDEPMPIMGPSLGTRFKRGVRTVFDKTLLGKIINRLGGPPPGSPDYNVTANFISRPDDGFGRGDGLGVDPRLILMRAQQAGTMDNVPEEDEEDEAFQMARRFRADGGIMNTQIRQAYGIGDIVEKATRAVKKVAKSPIGKAALLYTATGGLGNLASGQSFFSNFLSPTQFLSNTGSIFSKEGLRNILVGRPESIISPLGQDIFRQAATKGILGVGGKLSIGKAITAASLLPLLGIGTGDESEEEAQALLDQSGIDIDRLRNDSVYREATLARRFKAEGGSMKEPVAKKTMPLLDMGGQEMDLRAEGGFVPIGRMEKADDVPARLSKNEFVFTADAVRNAGDGDVDKGAEVMYNMMKNLEAGGDVSQESQGLEGARKMFQTSQRLEEVI